MTSTVVVPMSEYGGRVVSPDMFADLGVGEASFTISDDCLCVRFETILSAAVRATVAERLGSLNDVEAVLTARADTALTTNRDFLTIAAPTNAQTLAHVKALTHQNTAVIRLLLRRLDATD
jgi:hypothetical protein